jgi:uncharacterized protein (DUF1015 family)
VVALSAVDAWVVRPSWGPSVVGQPYDGLRPAERRRLADANADSFFNVVRSPVDYGEGPVPDDLLAGNNRALERLLGGGRYRPPERPELYVYGLHSEHGRQLAVVADVPVAAFRDGEVRAHERTREAKEAELARHLAELRMSSSPVGLTYRASPTVDGLVTATVAAPPLCDFAAADGVRQTVWTVPAGATAELLAAFGAVGSAYIVDGHHRVAAATRVGDRAFLAGLVPHDQLHLLPYHRVVAGPLPLPAADLLARAEAEPADPPTGWPPPGEVRLYVGGGWYRVLLDRRPAGMLDVEAVGHQVLGPLAGVTDPRSDPRLDFVPGNAGAALLAQLADATGGLAVALHPPTVEQLLACADAGETMPPKSTWFEPKLRSGVFVVRRPPLDGG